MADRITDPKGGRLPHRADGVWPAHLQQLTDRVSEDDVIRGCRSSLAQEGLFVAVQEAFLTETASGPTWSCRPLRGPIGRVPAPTPTGPAIFKGAHVQPSHEEPNQECPLCSPPAGSSVTSTAGPRPTAPSRRPAPPRRLGGAVEGRRGWLEVAEGNLLQATFPRGHLDATA